MNVPKLTKEQTIVISGFTGIFCGHWSDYAAEVERRLGRPVMTHEFADLETVKEIENAFRDDFLTMIGQ